jgi:hypothetical protein
MPEGENKNAKYIKNKKCDFIQYNTTGNSSIAEHTVHLPGLSAYRLICCGKTNSANKWA